MTDSDQTLPVLLPQRFYAVDGTLLSPVNTGEVIQRLLSDNIWTAASRAAHQEAVDLFLYV